MAQLLGTNIIAPILPGDTSDNFPTHVDEYGKGGYRSVSGALERDAIPLDRRSAGMMVQTQADGKFWVLNTGLVDWIELPFTNANIRIDTENIVYTTGDQDIVSGIKTFRNYNDTRFYGRTRAMSGIFSNLAVVEDLIFFGPRILDVGCTTGWCQQPEDELLDPDMPFDPRRKLTGNLGYSSLGVETIRIGEGTRSGAKNPIFTMWIGRTGIGPSGYGYEVTMASRNLSLGFSRPSSAIYPRLRGVEFPTPELTGTFDDQPAGTFQEIQNEVIDLSFNNVQADGFGASRPGDFTNGGDAGGGGFGLNFGAGVLMLFASTAPTIKFKDQYDRRFRAFSVVEKGSSWPTGFRLIWGPFINHLYTKEKYYAEGQLLFGTGVGINGETDYRVINTGVKEYRTSGLYNITEKISWDLFFTGRIGGFRGDYDIEPWTGHSRTEIYPVSKRYWGTSDKNTLTSDEITGLLSGEYAFDPRQVGSSAKRINPDGNYIYFAWPTYTGFNNVDFFKDYSNSKYMQYVPNGYRFFLDDQETTFDQSIVTGVKNKYNYEEDYYLFKSRWQLNGTERVKVSVDTRDN